MAPTPLISVALWCSALHGELANLLFTDRYGAALNEVVLDDTLSVEARRLRSRRSPAAARAHRLDAMWPRTCPPRPPGVTASACDWPTTFSFCASASAAAM